MSPWPHDTVSLCVAKTWYHELGSATTTSATRLSHYWTARLAFQTGHSTGLGLAKRLSRLPSEKCNLPLRHPTTRSKYRNGSSNTPDSSRVASVPKAEARGTGSTAGRLCYLCTYENWARRSPDSRPRSTLSCPFYEPTTLSSASRCGGAAAPGLELSHLPRAASTSQVPRHEIKRIQASEMAQSV